MPTSQIVLFLLFLPGSQSGVLPRLCWRWIKSEGQAGGEERRPSTPRRKANEHSHNILPDGIRLIHTHTTERSCLVVCQGGRVPQASPATRGSLTREEEIGRVCRKPYSSLRRQNKARIVLPYSSVLCVSSFGTSFACMFDVSVVIWVPRITYCPTSSQTNRWAHFCLLSLSCYSFPSFPFLSPPLRRRRKLNGHEPLLQALQLCASSQSCL